MLLIGRTPAFSSRCCIQAGDGWIFTSLIILAIYRGQRSESIIATFVHFSASSLSSFKFICGSLSLFPVIATTSLAIPIIPRQSGRFGVISNSRTTSSRSRNLPISSPIGAAPSRIIKPLASSPSPSSASEHIIPSETTPLIFAFLISNPPDSFAPTKATATFSPFLALGAPHTILSNSFFPTSTRQTVSLSALGCLTTCFIWPITISLKSCPKYWIASTPVPVISNFSAKAAGERSKSTYSLSQFKETLIYHLEQLDSSDKFFYQLTGLFCPVLSTSQKWMAIY